MAAEEMSQSRDEVIRLAFELEGKPPAEILLQLGTLDVWREDLSAMRGDTPPTEVSEPVTPLHDDADVQTEKLYAGITMRNALQYLTEKCRDVLYLRHVEQWEIGALADEFETSVDDADQLISNCRQRAYQLAEEVGSSPLIISTAHMPPTRASKQRHHPPQRS